MENEPGNCKECKKNLGERFIRWQQITIAETGKTISLFLAVSFATIGFVINQLSRADFRFKNCWDNVFVISGTILLLVSISIFLYTILNRLKDFRKTTQKIKSEKDKDYFLKDKLEKETKKIGKITWALFNFGLWTFGISEFFIIIGFIIQVSIKFR